MNEDQQYSKEADEPTPWYSLRVGVDPVFSPITQFFVSVDAGHIVLIVVYWIICLVSHFFTQQYRRAADDYFCEMMVNAGAGFNTFDLYLTAVVVIIFVGTDFWKMGFSIYTYILFVLFSSIVNMAVALPFYLSLRVSRKCKLNDKNYIEKNYNKSDNKFILFPLLWLILWVWFFLPINALNVWTTNCDD